MNSRELINKMFKHEKVERVGLLDSPWSDTLKRWVKEGYPKKKDSDEPVSPGEHFGFDMCHVPYQGLQRSRRRI